MTMTIRQANGLTQHTPETIEPTRAAVAAWANLVFPIYGGALAADNISTAYLGFDPKVNGEVWQVRIDGRPAGYCDKEPL